MIGTTQTWKIGDCVELMKELPDKSIDTVITSPPYYNLRDYQVGGQIGMESSLEEYHKRLLEVTAEIYRVMKHSAVLFWNHGDSYDDKCLIMQNERLIIKMIDNQGWILRNRIIWQKKNPMPSSVTDRFSNTYEPIYMLTKQKSYWFDLDAVRKPYTAPMNRWGGQKLKADGKSKYTDNDVQGGYRERDMRPNPLGKNPGDVWTIPTQPYPESHFATFPTTLIEPMIKAACPAEICPVCGLARERITEKETVSPRTINGIPNNSSRYGAPDSRDPTTKPTPSLNCGETIHHTTGWTSCDCGAGWIAGTVLDPFAGSGTVGEVARKLNRNAILLELNPEYERLISKRIMKDTPPLTAYFGDD